MACWDFFGQGLSMHPFCFLYIYIHLVNLLPSLWESLMLKPPSTKAQVSNSGLEGQCHTCFSTNLPLNTPKSRQSADKARFRKSQAAGFQPSWRGVSHLYTWAGPSSVTASFSTPQAALSSEPTSAFSWFHKQSSFTCSFVLLLSV